MGMWLESHLCLFQIFNGGTNSVIPPEQWVCPWVTSLTVGSVLAGSGKWGRAVLDLSSGHNGPHYADQGTNKKILLGAKYIYSKYTF